MFSSDFRTSLNRKAAIHARYVYGLGVDGRTGCVHYRAPFDIVAIRFKCCRRYYACYDCHQALSGHSPERWQPQDINFPAILCGHCGKEMTIRQYLFSEFRCVHCKSAFNPACRSHWDLYFEPSIFG